MSNIELSPQLFQELQQAIIKADSQAAQEPMLVMQYLVAVAGYILGSQNMDEEQLNEYSNDLGGFLHHVMEDTYAKAVQQRQQVAASAFGYWEPPKK